MKRFKIKKLNNEGAALILAMVIVLFITVLTSLLLYISGVNYEMKTADYRDRVSFYGAEQPLEELRVILAADVSKAAEAAYKDVFLRYTDLNSEEVRRDEFENLFYNNIEKIWKDRGVNDFTDSIKWEAALESLMDTSVYDVYESTEAKDSSKAYHIEVMVKDPINGVKGTILEREPSKDRILLRQIKVYYTENDFLSVINTDFVMDVPKIDWSVDFYDSPAGGISSEDAKTKSISFEKCVNYLDWEKQ